MKSIEARYGKTWAVRKSRGACVSLVVWSEQRRSV